MCMLTKTLYFLISLTEKYDLEIYHIISFFPTPPFSALNNVQSSSNEAIKYSCFYHVSIILLLTRMPESKKMMFSDSAPFALLLCSGVKWTALHRYFWNNEAWMTLFVFHLSNLAADS